MIFLGSNIQFISEPDYLGCFPITTCTIIVSRFGFVLFSLLPVFYRIIRENVTLLKFKGFVFHVMDWMLVLQVSVMFSCLPVMTNGGKHWVLIMAKYGQTYWCHQHRMNWPEYLAYKTFDYVKIEETSCCCLFSQWRMGLLTNRPLREN